jgi:DNA end-binding protein Ku
LGLVNISVKLYSAVSRKAVRFNQIGSATGSRVKQKRVSAADGEEVPYQRVVKDFELPSREFVLISDDNAYHLVPDEQTAKPYKLLATAMEQAGKVGICHFVMRS